MSRFLPNIQGPQDLKKLSNQELTLLAQEMRDELVRVLSIRPAHFASNLGVVELCLALHLTFDFRKDRLIWDTGHQIYPHKLITGRQKDFSSIRTKGGLMGYPNPDESEFDLFMTGHAGASISTVLGLKAGDDQLGETQRHSVAVIGDGALPSGIVFEALNNAGGLGKNLLVILNDNEMSICPRVGALARCLDQARLTSFYQDSKRQARDLLTKIPLIGPMAKAALEQLKDGLKAFLTGGMLFEELGFRYFGPIDGHDLPSLRKWLEDVKNQKGPILLHVLTQKGHGVPQASQDPVTYHTPPVFEKVGPERTILALKKGGSKAYTDVVSNCLHKIMQENGKVAVITAAMCQGNKLEKIREEFPTRFFDVGICESHAVAFAAGMAKAGARPVVDIYSTFLQRSFDQIFQEVALQNLPVVFCMDRAGLTGPDGPTHHGVFDNTYMRLFPNMTLMAPGDELDVEPMLRLALQLKGPSGIRYPKASLDRVERDLVPMEPGQAEVIEWGEDIILISYGTLLKECEKAASQLREEGLSVGLINARFLKPLDRATICKAIEEATVVITVEESTLEGGFGSAVLEAANAAGLDTRKILRRGIPDHFIPHAERAELLKDLKLDHQGIVELTKNWLARAIESPGENELHKPEYFPGH
ncbi:MAG: 1-deoxy-D-xylulose-5-phosphate synthase [Gemmataceae bacterium]|nr:1-deoxy-D-xylulose-5-phosphate synthase [Gemmataceae bacterium]